MTTKSWLYKILSISVTIGLLLQGFPIPPAVHGNTSFHAESMIMANTAVNGMNAGSQSATPRPISIARSQSSYTVGSGVIITYTVTNNLPPVLAPDVTPGQTLTDTLAAIDAFEPGRDPNTVRQVILTNEWSMAATYLGASRPAYIADGVYTFLLEDIPPLSSITVVVELDGPPEVTEPTMLDGGATAWATVHGRAAQASTTAASLWPDTMSDWLACTIDANCADSYIIEQAGQLGNDPELIFDFVRGLAYESYQGSLRGARGALWSEAGNSTDQASLLIALLRAGGVPARYRSGTLEDIQIETLLLAMFPNAPGVIGYIPDNVELPLADPLQNDTLWDESRGHWWVEAYLPGSGWTDLDPTFAQAEIGDRFVTDPDPIPLAELPADLRHTVTLRLKVERYNPLYIGGLNVSYPLNITLAAVELVGEPVSLGHMVNSSNQGGLIFSTISHTYTPYMVAGFQESLHEGTPFQEFMTNFPLATTIVTGEWLIIELQRPDGTTEEYERALYDGVGYDARLNGGTIQVGESGRTNEPFISELSVYTTLFSPSFIPAGVIDRDYQQMVTAVTEGQVAYDNLNAIMADGVVDPDESATLIEAVRAISRLARASQRAQLLQYAAAADFGTRRLGDAFLVRPYYDTPRVHTLAWETDAINGTQRATLDLRRNNVRALPYPGQSLRGWQAFNVSYGLAAMSLESDLLQRLVPDEPVMSVANILTAANEQGIPLTLISPANLDDLAGLTISNEAKARITADLAQNPRHIVLVPTAPVTLGDQESVGWLRSDIVSGETIDVSEDGLHVVSVEYSILISGSIQEYGFAIAGFGQGFAGFTIVFLAEFLGAMPGDMKAAWNAALAAAEQWASDMAELLAEMYDHPWVEAFINGAGVQGGGTVDTPIGEFNFGEFDWRQGGFNNGAAFAASVIGSADPPLPPALAARLSDHEFHRPATGLVAATATSSGTAVDGSASLDSFAATGDLTATWDNNAQSGLLFSYLAGQGDLYVNGAPVGSGAVSAQPESSLARAETSATATAYQATGMAGMSFYAPAVTGLGAGASWDETALTLTPGASLTVTLHGAVATLDGQTYTGTLTLVTGQPVTVQGAGPAVSPHFAGSAMLTAVNADLALGVGESSLTIGGTAVPLSNGLALSNFSGEITVNEDGPVTDEVTLAGDAHFFHLATDPAGSVTTPGQPATFQTIIAANFSDTYTVTATAPGWAAAVTPNGNVIITPTLATPPGEYTVLLTAQSALYPTAVAAVEQGVTVEAIQGVDVTIQPDPIYTIPWGGPDDPANPTTNNGQVQIPDAAYTVQITNRSSTAHTFDVTVSGLPAGWLIFAGQEGQTAGQVTLSAGATTWLGLYVRPDTPDLPAPGGSHSFTVTAVAVSDPAVNDSDNTTFVMPAVPFQQLWLEPANLFVTGQSATEFAIYLHNIGNTAGNFDLAAQLPAGWSLDNLQAPVAAAVGETTSQIVTLHVPGEQSSRVYPVTIISPAPGMVYQQAATLNVHLVNAAAAPIFNAAQGCLADQQPLASALHALALGVDGLSASCEDGNCSLALRDQVVNTAFSAANYAHQSFPPMPGMEMLELTAEQLSTANDSVAIQAILLDMAAAVSTMEAELCALLAYQPALQLTPWMEAALPGQTAVYDLALTNKGSLTTTYAVTVTLPNETMTLAETLLPGTTVTTAVPVSITQLGLHTIQATAAAQEMDNDLPPVTAVAEAYLNVVDRFVQVVEVAASPPFVETGVSTTTLQAEIANVAGLRQTTVAHAAVIAPSGLVRWSDEIPLTILTGSPRLYTLGEVATSGWSQGIYTITLNLVDNDGAPIPGGSGHGYLVVGQGLYLSHSVAPLLVTPGTVTVTTGITTEVLSQQTAVNSEQLIVNSADAQERDLSHYPTATDNDEPLVIDADQAPIVNEEVAELAESLTDEELALDDGQSVSDEALSIQDETADDLGEPILNRDAAAVIHTTPGIIRHEQDAFTFDGSWSIVNLAWASGGQAARSVTAGNSASFTFDGTWVGLGLATGTANGHAEIFIDGVSQGVVDTYSRYNDVAAYYFGDLISGTHTISVTVLGTRNAFASNHRVEIDYVDVWDGMPLAEGSFEENDGRVYLSNGWVTMSEAGASGGQYIRSQFATTHTNAWFHFAGDSLTFQALAYNGAGLTKILIDNELQGVFDLFSASPVTRTFSFDNLGPGAHVMQITSYRGRATIDRFVTPGESPFYEPPVQEGFTRYEEDDSALLYNGVSFGQTAQSWNMGAISWASAGYGTWSNTAGDTVSLTFDGEWVSLGLATRINAGLGEVFIDGVSQGIVDTYSRYDDVLTLAYELAPGTHTISVTVLGQRNDFATADFVRLDYVDVWDGTAVPEGSFEENDTRVYLSDSWTAVNETAASGGRYVRSTNTSSHTNTWFNFVGDSVTFQALAYSGAGATKILIDGQVQGVFDLFNATPVTRTFSFNNLGPGAHVIQLRDYRGRATLDRFVTPGEAPFYEPPLREGFVRYEEDDPALLYNGVPWEQTATSWNMATYGWSSGGYGMWSDVAGDTVSLTFNGQWVSVGLITRNTAGLAEIFIDGVSQGVVDTYTRYDDVLTLAYDLTPGTHTITVTVLGQNNGLNNQRYVRLDYIDVWDGTTIADGSFEEEDERVYLTDSWVGVNEGAASGGRYVRSSGTAAIVNAWFHFVGDSVTYQALAYNGAELVEILIDGQSQGVFDLYNATPVTRTYSFDNLGSGAHVIQLSSYRGRSTLDRFVTPGEPPFYEAPLRQGIVRYEEDDPALLYNGAPFHLKPTTWTELAYGQASSGYGVWSATAGNNVSLTFEGAWVGVGFLTYPAAGLAEIFINGESQGIVNTYSPELRTKAVYYPLLQGTHTISVTVLGDRLPPSTNNNVRLDYIDVWDGTAMPDGVFEEWNGRIHLSNSWVVVSEGAASDGSYIRSSGTSANVSAWFPFTGDSVTYQALAYSGAGQVDILLDGDYVGAYDLHNDTPSPRTFSFGNLDDGPHVLQLQYNSGRVTLDRFDQPGSSPFIPHYQVDIIPITAFPGGRPGGTAVQTIHLHNQGIQPDSYDLIISGAEWATEVISTVYLLPSEIRPIQVTSTVPAGTPLGESDTFTLTAVSQTDSNVTAVETLTSYAVSVDAQLCIAMDGSGSISGAEFQLMVGGLAAAMRDSTAVPRNTTIEFSIVQFAGSTRTEIAPVVIVNENAAEWVAQQIEQIPQLGGGTPMQDAIDLCTELLTTSPHTTHALRQVINMVTDGEPNNAAATITARNNAIAAGVDQINAEAIGVTNAAIAFLRDELVYPEPGYEAPPFIPGQGGFVIRADTFEEFVESIGQKVQFALDTGYTIELSHIVPITAVQLITGTIVPPPVAITPTAGADTLYWEYSLFAEDNSRSHTLETVLPDMQPGETRAVSQGTEVYYRLSGGENWLSLPPLYVSAAHIIAIEPETRNVALGSTAVYTITLLNPAPLDDVYTLALLGAPGDWATYPLVVNMPAASEVTVLLELSPPTAAAVGEYPFVVTVVNSSDGHDMAAAALELFNSLEIAIDPPIRTAPTGTAVTYTLTLTNNQQSTANNQLSTSGLAQVALPESVTIPANTAVSLPITVTSTAHGPQPFTVTAVGSGGSGVADAILVATGHYAVGLALDPESGVAGPATPAEFSLTITNLGDSPDGYDLSLELPAGWSGFLAANGEPLESVALPPHLFNSVALDLRITPPSGTAVGNYEFIATAVSQSRPGVQATVTGTIELLPLGVQVAISPQHTSQSPLDSGAWQVTITNSGEVVDSYDLAAVGIVALTAEFSSSSVTLSPGQSQTVQMMTDPMPFALPQTYLFGVRAVSQADNRIANEDQANLTFTGYEGVDVTWNPGSQTVTDTLSATFMLLITNTGNISTHYHFGLVMPGLVGQLPLNGLTIPPHMATMLPVTVQATSSGTYTIEGTAVSNSGAASDSDTATLTIVAPNQPPLVNAGPDQTVEVGETVQFNGSASDPDGDPLTITWEFGDGAGAAGTLTPTHIYEAIGLYTVTLTAADTAGHVVSDTLQVTVTEADLPPLEVDAGPDQAVDVGETVQFNGSAHDPAGGPLAITWEFGDGNGAVDSLTPTHVYETIGLYTVTLTVAGTGDRVVSDTLRVAVIDPGLPPLEVNAGPDAAVDEGAPLAFSGLYTDTEGATPYTILWEFGDGRTAAGTLSPEHTYLDDGTYTVTLTVMAGDGRVGSDSLVVTVENVAPAVTAVADQQVTIDDVLALVVATFTDPGALDTHTAVIDWGDGTVTTGVVDQVAGTISGAHTYTELGVYTVTITVTDKDDGQGSDSFTVTVGPRLLYLPIIMNNH